jgi:uncharacterized protein (DUF2252 family)
VPRKSASVPRPANPKTPPAPVTVSEVWAPEPPHDGDVWTPRPWVHPDERRAEGKRARQAVPRTSHAAWSPAEGRDPIGILQAQEADRLQDLVPLRHERMAASAFAYYRGTPAVMAFDLSSTPSTNIIVQASGDAHIGNFGMFASPERRLVFDTNDFDETLPAPWEWDVKRLATSVIIAGRENGFPAAANRAAAMTAVRVYRERMASYAAMRLIDVWYAHLGETEIREAAAAVMEKVPGNNAKRMARIEAIFTKARSRDQMKAAASLTELVDGHRRIIDAPPTVQHVEIPGGMEALSAVFEAYRASLSDNRREFLERYRFADFALKVVGVGSVGTRCFVCVLEGRDENDPLILQAKEAPASVLEPYVAKSEFDNQGQRVVVGQRLMQATPDIFLGWTRGPGGRAFYFRQLWDMKGSVDTTTLEAPGLGFYAGVCAWALARAHARSGDATAISAYLGTTDTFDGAIADFAETYADRNAEDHKAFVEAIRSGRISGSVA